MPALRAAGSPGVGEHLLVRCTRHGFEEEVDVGSCTHEMGYTLLNNATSRIYPQIVQALSLFDMLCFLLYMESRSQ